MPRSPFLTGLRWNDLRVQLFVALSLALAPIHTGIATANPAIIVVGVCVGAVWAAETQRQKLAGFLLAAAVCMKPQVGLVFLSYYLVRRRWRVAAWAGAWTVAVSVIAAARFAASGTGWISAYAQGNKEVFARGAINDFTSLNPSWYNMINLQVPLWQLLKNAALANLLALMLGLFLLGIWFYRIVQRETSSPLLEVSCLAALSLLPVYHRFYDAGLLILPLAWSVIAAKSVRDRFKVLTIACIIPFLIPGATLLNRWAEHGRIPAVIRSAWWWNALVVSHEVWAVLALAVVLLGALKNSGADSAESKTG